MQAKPIRRSMCDRFGEINSETPMQASAASAASCSTLGNARLTAPKFGSNVPGTLNATLEFLMIVARFGSTGAIACDNGAVRLVPPIVMFPTLLPMRRACANARAFENTFCIELVLRTDCNATLISEVAFAGMLPIEFDIALVIELAMSLRTMGFSMILCAAVAKRP